MFGTKNLLKTIELLILYLICTIVAIPSYAATSPWAEDQYAKARLVVGGQEDGQYYAGMEIIAEKGWKMYWRTPGDAGFPPVLDWLHSKNIRQFSVKWPVPERDIEYFDGGELESYVYKERLFLPILTSPKRVDKPQHFVVNLDYAVCKEVCIPVSASFDLKIPELYADKKQIDRIRKALVGIPQKNGSNGLAITGQDWVVKDGRHYIRVQAESTVPFRQPDIFIESKALVKFSAPDIRYSGKNHAVFYAEIIPAAKRAIALHGKKLRLTLVNGSQAIEKNFTVKRLVHETAFFSARFMAVLGLAFLGGLILNIMPCVLPVLSIKLLTILQQGGAAIHVVRRGFIASALGILTSFLLLAGLTILLQLSGQAVGWGFHFQNPAFLVALIVVLVVFAGNVSGRFEINLPGGVADFLLQKTPMKHHNVRGDFMAGVFATLLATPCTAPFLGTAVSFALSRGAADIVIIFTFMGLGLAFPYIVFSLFPHWVTKLPKPGEWMVKVKYILVLFLLLTALWLVWVLSHSLGTNAAIAVFFAVLLGALAVGLKIKTSFRITGILVALVIAFSMPFIRVQEKGTEQNPAGQWVMFDEKTIPELVAEGKVVFVDVTADWCLTCKFNKLRVLDQEAVKKHLQSPGVVAMQADITRPDPHILEYLKRYDRYGIPFNIVYGPAEPEGILLNELLSVNEVNQALQRAEGKKPAGN